MKKITFLILVFLVFVACKETSKKDQESVEKEVVQSVKEDNASEWITLFDGTSMDKWRGYLRDDMPEEWTINNGNLLFTPGEEGGKDIITKDTFTNFILSLEWKISEGGNSGIFWGVHEDPNLPEAYQTGPEIQVLDNDKHPDGKNGTTHQAGALYDMVAPSADVTKPVGEWNSIEITINHKTNEGSVVLNDVEIVNFPVNDPGWSEMVSTSKFADWEHFGKYKTGKIGFQDHGDKVAFRNIKIKEL